MRGHQGRLTGTSSSAVTCKLVSHCVYVHVHAQHALAHKQAHMHTFTCTRLYTHPYTQYTHTHSRRCTHIHIRTLPLHTLTQCTYTFAYMFLHSSHMHTHPQTCTRMHANTSACTQMHTCWRRQVALPIRWFRIMDCRSIVFMKKNPRRFQKAKLGFAVCRAAAESVRMSGVWCVGRRGGGLPANAGRVLVPRRL